jgi:peptidase M15-like protein
MPRVMNDQWPASLGTDNQLSPNLIDIEHEEQCTTGANNYNANVANYGRRLIRLLDVVQGEIVNIENGSRRLQPLAIAVRNHDSQVHAVMYVYCLPSGPVVERTFDRQRNYVALLKQRGTLAVRNLFAAFEIAVKEAEDVALEIRNLRTTFDAMESPPRDIQQQFDSRTVQFNMLRQTCETFKLVRLAIGSSVWDPADLMRRLDDSTNEVERLAALSELDYLRFEYAMRGISCPLPGRFSQGKRSIYFSNAQLNNGAYTWAILPDYVLTMLDAVYVDMRNRGYPIQLNSFYRNPAHNDGIGGAPTSLHQYGQAVDMQTFDFDGSNTTDKTDWQLLESVFLAQNPKPHIEPIELSGVGHVHAEWK